MRENYRKSGVAREKIISGTLRHRVDSVMKGRHDSATIISTPNKKPIQPTRTGPADSPTLK